MNSSSNPRRKAAEEGQVTDVCAYTQDAMVMIDIKNTFE